MLETLQKKKKKKNLHNHQISRAVDVGSSMDRGRPDASNSTIKNSTRHQMIAVSQLSCWKLRRKNIRCNACAESIYPHPGNWPCLEHWRKNCKTCIPYRQMISDPLRTFGYFTRWSMVNGQPCMPHWAACFRHRGNVKQFRLFYKVFADMLLPRIENILELE